MAVIVFDERDHETTLAEVVPSEPATSLSTRAVTMRIARSGPFHVVVE